MTVTNDYIFDEYRPKSGNFPGYFDPDFHVIENTASELLSGFTESEIIECVWHFDDYLHRLNPQGSPSTDDWQRNGDPYGAYVGGRQLNVLHWCMKDLPIPTDVFGRNIEAFEAYALVALSIIAMGFREEPKLEDAGDVEELYWRLARYAIEGSKFVTIAETLKLNPETKIPEQAYKARIASSGGQARSRKFRPLKLAVFERWTNQYQGRSHRDAAKRIWKDLPDEIKRNHEGKMILSTPEPEATVEKWIGVFARGDRP